MILRLLALAFLPVLVTPSSAAQEVAEIRPWEHESSDLPVDPKLHFGHFENGMRWVWARNSEPKYRSYLRLHVNVGSLAEEESERGMAHFLEHMAFNGSENFEADTLVEWFQRHGMAFGADLNAHTGFSETVYQLDLPNSDAELIDEGLLVLRDFAFGLSLAQEEIEKEKGVIDGEERERDSPSYRLFVRQLRERLGDTRLDDRIPIGVQETRAAFTSDSIGAFYSKWYRPEHMTLILVGDLGELDPVPLFEQHFGGVPRPGEPLTQEPPPGAVTQLEQRLCFFEPEIPSVSIRVESLTPWDSEPYTAALLREKTPLSVARRIVGLRFQELVKEADAPFLGAGLSSAEALEVLDGEELQISCAPDKWKEAMALGEQELRRALQHGFQQAELDEVRANALRGLREAVEREATRTSSGLVGAVLRAAENRYVPTSAATRLETLQPVYDALTPEMCRAALLAAWSSGELSISTIGSLDLGPDAADALNEIWAASRAVAVEKGSEISVAEFAYLPEAKEALPLPELVAVEGLDFHTARFENGVRLAVKQTDFKEKQILFRVGLGEGRLSLAARDLPLSWMAERVFEAGGLGQHTIDEIRRMLAGKQVSLSFSVGTESFTFSGATTKEDLRLQCALVCAFLQDAAWRDGGYVRVKRELPLIYDGLKHQHQGPLLFEFMAALFDGDERFSFFQQAKLEAVELEAVNAWLTPFLGAAPLEVSFVGDLDEAEVMSAVASTFGRLPARRPLRPYDEHRSAPIPKSGIHQEHQIDTQVPKSLVLIAFPVPDEIEVERKRRFQFLTEVLRDRLRVEVRERLGAAYSPGAGLQQSRTFPGVGLLMVQAMTEPAEAKTLLEACLEVTDSLAADGITAEEVDRLREPILKGMRDTRRQNGWWLSVLAESRRRPELLEEVRSEQAYFESLGPEPLSELARTYLQRERASTVMVHPRDVEAEPAVKEGGD